MCRTAYSPITMPSSPSITFHTRIPPDSSAANALPTRECITGAGLLLAGVVVNAILIAVAGFVIMLACSMWALTSYRRMTGSTTGRPPVTGRDAGNKRRAARVRRAGKNAESGLMGRLEKRWRRRQQATADPPAARCRRLHHRHGGSPASHGHLSWSAGGGTAQDTR
jgi:hypothetical protein